jgi:hypothetical protein
MMLKLCVILNALTNVDSIFSQRGHAPVSLSVQYVVGGKQAGRRGCAPNQFCSWAARGSPQHLLCRVGSGRAQRFTEDLSETKAIPQRESSFGDARWPASDKISWWVPSNGGTSRLSLRNLLLLLWSFEKKSVMWH